MTKRTFGKTGFKVTPLGFGSAPVAYLKTDPERATALLNNILDQGINLLDTAASYPGSEAFLGSAIMHRRSEFVLVSKCGPKQADLPGEAWSRELITATIDRALAQLKTDVIDVMLLHSCDLETLKKGEALGALADARKAGKIRFAGYSGDNETAAWAAEQPDVSVIETSINIADQRNIDTVLPVCARHNVGVLAKRPIANAAWKDIGQQPGMYRDYARQYTERLAKMSLRPSDLGFAGSPAQAWPEIALRFTLSFPQVHCAIIGTTNPENAKANIEAARKGPLPEQAVDKLRAAFRSADPEGQWVGLT